MPQKTILKDRNTSDSMYPITHQDCIITDDNSGVATKRDVDEKIAGELNSSPAQLEVINSIAERLKDDDNLANVLTNEIKDAKFALFVDMWNTACDKYGKYNAETGFFELNGLTDITYEQALLIYDNKSSFPIYKPVKTGVRTNLIDNINQTGSAVPNSNITTTYAFGASTEVARLAGDNVSVTIPNDTSKYWGMFHAANKLHTIFGILNLKNITSSFVYVFHTGKALQALQNVNIKELHYDFLMLRDAGKISYESVRYLIDNATNTSAINITVHSGIYNALLNQDTTYPFNGGTQDEWESLFQDAAKRDISFVTS